MMNTIKNWLIKIGEGVLLIIALFIIGVLINFVNNPHMDKNNPTNSNMVLCEEQCYNVLTKDGAHISIYIHVHDENPKIICDKIYKETSEYVANYTLLDYIKYKEKIDEIITKQAITTGKNCQVCEFKIN